MTPALPRELLVLPVFDVAQARSAGLDGFALRSALASGRLVRVARGWYSPRVRASEDQRFLHRAMASARTHDAVLTGIAALVAHGLPVYDIADRPVVLMSPRGELRNRGGVRLIAPLSGEPRVSRPDLVTPAEAVAVAALDDPVLTLGAADSALRREIVTRQEIEQQMSRLEGRRGVRRAVALLDVLDSRHESVGESRLAWVLHLWGLDAEPQVRIPLSAGVARPDFRLVGTRVLVEFDGMQKYATVEDLRAEKRREDELRRMGYVIVRVVWADLYRLDVLRQRLLDAVELDRRLSAA